MKSPSKTHSLIPLSSELSNAVQGDDIDRSKEEFLNIVGMLQHEDDPPPFPDSSYTRNTYLKFFELFTETAYFPDEEYHNHPNKTNFRDEVHKVEKMLEEHILESHSLLDDQHNPMNFLKGRESEPGHEQLNNLSLQIFGGHTEHLVLLLTARKSPDDVREFVKNRYRKQKSDYNHKDPLKRAVIHAHNRLCVAPVYVRGSCKRAGDSYFILQLCPKPFGLEGPEGGVSEISLRYLHTTFCIKKEEDHPDPEEDIVGSHKQIRLQGGMQQLARRDPQNDAIPILLDNSRILSSSEEVGWN